MDMNVFWRAFHNTGRDHLCKLGHIVEEYVSKKAFTFAGHLARVELRVVEHLLLRFNTRRWKFLQGTGDYMHRGRYRLE